MLMDNTMKDFLIFTYNHELLTQRLQKTSEKGKCKHDYIMTMFKTKQNKQTNKNR